MEVVSGVTSLGPDNGRLFVAIGVFDGLHRGHAYLLRHLRREAEKRRARATVITFDHHPDEILVGAAPPLLCDPAERLERLGSAGVELTIVQHFDALLRQTEYDAFVASIRERVELAGFVMTPDAAFGYERRGTPAALADLGLQLGFEVAIVPPFEVDGRPVRSTDIRSAIASGDLATAARLLGRPVAVVGDATPTPAGARVEFELPVALPASGRYAVLAQVAGTPIDARASIKDGRLELDRRMRGPVRIEFRGSAGPTR